MSGEVSPVWSETGREIWTVLATSDAAPPDLFCELYREATASMRVPPSIEALAAVVSDPGRSREMFESVVGGDFAGERALVGFLEGAHSVLDDLAGDSLSNAYFLLLEGFVQKFSLRYELRRPCVLCPTLPGVFSSLMGDLRQITLRDAHLTMLMRDFDMAVRDLRGDCSDGRIKTCIQKQVNLLEALGQGHPKVTKNTLGQICEQVGTWPHVQLKDAMKNLYGFACDYPGIRHGGTPAGAIRTIDMRDMVAMCILLAGFTPYLTDQLVAENIYRRS